MTSKELLRLFPDVKITENQLNRIRKEWGLERKRGRPKGKNQTQSPPVEEKARPKIWHCLHLPKIGLRLFALWMEQTQRHVPVLETIYELIAEYKKEHPEENFRLLRHSKETIARKWKALSILGLAGIKKLSELDYHQHDLDRILVDGYSYSYSSLRQFLAELERVNAGASLKNLLSRSVNGEWAYIDGHMIAYWAKIKMHKGYITMLGRIMSGSKLVVTHDKDGNAIGFDYYSPDTHLINVIEDYCQSIVDLTGVKNFVIDREINSAGIANLFEEHGWGIICLLAANEYDGLDSFNKHYCKTLDDGTVLYKASWKFYRKDDPRYFIIAKEKDRVLVYWYTKKVAKLGLRAERIIKIYRTRAEVQENGFKRMIAHGALNTNFGYKKIWATDRHHQRKVEEIEGKIIKLRRRLRKLQDKIEEQMLKIQESINRKHNLLFYARFRKLMDMEDQEFAINKQIAGLESEKDKLGEPGLRADRDFRKQTIISR